MKSYHHHERGLTLFEVSIAISVAIVALLSFAPYYIKIMERVLVEQTAYRAKMVYEAAINYRLDNNDGKWPSNTTVLKDDGYLPEAAMQTSWGVDIELKPTGNDKDLNMKLTLPDTRFVNAVAARLPAPKIVGLEITQLIVRPGQEASLSELQDLAGERSWTGPHNADNNDLENVKRLQAKVIAANAVVNEGDDCTTSHVIGMDMQGLGEGARAIVETNTPGIYAPVFCNGKIWVREEKLKIIDCKVCVACSDGEPDGKWRLAMCDTPGNDGWKITGEAKPCFSDGKLAVKFVCGDDSTEGQWPDPNQPKAKNIINIEASKDY